MEYTIVLTSEQIETIKGALRTDYKEAQKLGALPIGTELQNQIKDAYAAIARQSATHDGQHP